MQLLSRLKMGQSLILSIFLMCFFGMGRSANLTIPEGRIWGGDEAVPHSFPYQVGLVMIFGNGDIGQCGGSLISERFVLTAAHCGYNVITGMLVLGAHEYLKAEPTQQKISINMDDIIIHPGYSADNYYHDIALIRLSPRAKLTKEIQIINLPKITEESNTYEGRKVVTSGWGSMGGDDNQSSDKLKYAKLDIFPNDKCRKEINGVMITSQICTDGGHKSNACQGDSGGPLVIEETNGMKTLIGITSFGSNRCDNGKPAVFTKVSAYLWWIYQYTGIPIRY